MAAETLALAIRELAPKLAQGSGLVRYSTYAFSDGRFGSFSVYELKSDASHAAQIAADWVKSSNTMQGFELDDAMEGEFIYAVQGFKPIELSKGEQVFDVDGPVHSLARIYKTNASSEDLIAALEQEAGDVIRNLPGLSRYCVVKLIDGRIDTLENARKSTEQAEVSAAAWRRASVPRSTPAARERPGQIPNVP